MPHMPLTVQTASFFDMAGGNNFSPQSDGQSSSECSPVFAVSEKDRKNSLLKVLVEESKEQRRTSFAEMAIQ